jgi:hypothetical protein
VGGTKHRDGNGGKAGLLPGSRHDGTGGMRQSGDC